MYDIISLILILLALYLVLHKNFNLGIMIFVVAVIFFVLFKRGEHFRSSLDIYYPSDTPSTQDKARMLSVYKNISKEDFQNPLSVPYRLNENSFNRPVYINKTYRASSDEIKNYFVNVVNNENYSYVILYKNNHTLNGSLFDINNSTVYLNHSDFEIESFNNQNENYIWKFEQNNVTNDTYSLNIKLQPKNTQTKKPIMGYLQGYNNGEVAINPVESNINSIFFLEDISDTNVKHNQENIGNIKKVIRCNIRCYNGLYLERSQFEKNKFNKHKVVMKKKPSDASGSWIILAIENTPTNLYNVFN